MYRAMNMDDVIRSHKEAGLHFFDEDTMIFFGSKVVSELLPGDIFITEEDNYDRSEKMYTIRRFDCETADIKDISRFGAFKTLKEAKEFVRDELS